MFNNVQSTAKIYKLIELKDPKSGKLMTYQMVPYADKFELPDKVYGDVIPNAKYIWNNFAKEKGRASLLCTGKKGNSKSLTCKVICNMAISVNVPVILIQELKVTYELIQLISTLNNCVIFIDEFGKTIGYNFQDLFLSLLSDSNKKRMFLLTENSTGPINSFILDRPERIRYHLEFNTVDVDVVKEYCKDHNVPEDFKNELVKIAMSNKDFCFDHLATLVNEATENNNYDMESLIKLLNLKVLEYKTGYIPCYICSKDNIDVKAKLDKSLVKEGISLITVMSSLEMSRQPKGKSAIEELYLNGADNEPVSEENTNNVQEDTTKDIDLLLANIDRDYLEVDTDIGGDDYMSYRRRQEMKGKVRIKINIIPDNFVREEDNYLVYQDVTGNYLVYLLYSKTTL